jgi:Tn3 transposase DDE domain
MGRTPPRSRAATSVALRRLLDFKAKNRSYHANREFLHIFKTEFILKYFSQPAPRNGVMVSGPRPSKHQLRSRDVLQSACP